MGSGEASRDRETSRSLTQSSHYLEPYLTDGRSTLVAKNILDFMDHKGNKYAARLSRATILIVRFSELIVLARP